MRFLSMPNRTLCAVLEEMRETLKVVDFINFRHCQSILKAQVEEAQSLGNRMEAAMEDIVDLPGLYEKRAELKKTIRELKKELAELTIDKAQLEEVQLENISYKDSYNEVLQSYKDLKEKYDAVLSEINNRRGDECRT